MNNYFITPRIISPDLPLYTCFSLITIFLSLITKYIHTNRFLYTLNFTYPILNLTKIFSVSRLKIFLVEDDDLFVIELMMKLRTSFEDASIVHFYSVDECKEALDFVTPDILLVDIILQGEEAGIHLAEIARKKSIPTIVMTAHLQKEMFNKVLKVKPANFLQKPFCIGQLKRSILLATENNKHVNENRFVDNFMLLKGKNRVVEKIDILDICSVEAFGNYCHLYTTTEKYTHRISLKKFKESAPSSLFVQIHRNYMINMRYLTAIDKKRNIVIVAGQEYPISQRQRALLSKKFPKFK